MGAEWPRAGDSMQHFLGVLYCIKSNTSEDL